MTKKYEKFFRVYVRRYTSGFALEFGLTRVLVIDLLKNLDFSINIDKER